MPLVRIPREVMVSLVGRVKKCTVTITQVDAQVVELKEDVKGAGTAATTEENKQEVQGEPTEEIKEEVREKKERPAGTGFIARCCDSFTVVGVHHSFNFDGQKAVVTFWDGTRATDTEVIQLGGNMNLIVANIAHGDWRQVEYAQIRGASQHVLSLVSAFSKLLPFVGRIISPRCICVDARDKVIPETRDTFSFNLPFAGKTGSRRDDKHDKRFETFKVYVLGAPVFNVDGRFLGFVLSCSGTYDFKLGMRSDNLRTVIDEWLGGRQWKDAIQP